MTDETLFIIIGSLLIMLGTLLLILKPRGKREADTFDKAARGQLIVLSTVMVLGGLILIIKNI